MDKNIPEKLIDFRCYSDGTDLLGMVDVTLPKVDLMSETVKGAGIAGEIDTQELELDFDKLKGTELVDLEGNCRAMGDTTPQLFFSMKYQTMIAAKAASVKYDDILALKVKDFNLILAAVNRFLFSSDLAAVKEN